MFITLKDQNVVSCEVTNDRNVRMLSHTIDIEMVDRQYVSENDASIRPNVQTSIHNLSNYIDRASRPYVFEDAPSNVTILCTFSYSQDMYNDEM